MLGPHCCVGFSLVVESRAYSLLVVCGLLTEVAPLVMELGSVGFSTCGMWAQQLRLLGSGAQSQLTVGHGLSFSAACGILPDQGSKLCPLH